MMQLNIINDQLTYIKNLYFYVELLFYLEFVVFKYSLH